MGSPSSSRSPARTAQALKTDLEEYSNFCSSPVYPPPQLTPTIPAFSLEEPKKAEVFIIGVGGGVASGKTDVCHRIINDLSDYRVVVVSQSDFIKGVSGSSSPLDYNFHHPDAYDYDFLLEILHKIKLGQAVDLPIFDFDTLQPSRNTRRIKPGAVVILEGMFVFHDERIRNLLSMKIFVHADSDVRLLRYLKGIDQSNRSHEEALLRYERYVKPCTDEYVYPSKKFADLIIPKWPNDVAVDLIVQHINSKLEVPDLRQNYPNLRVLHNNFQIRGLHTLIRNREISRSDFVFYTDRVIRLLIEDALGLLPFEEKLVQTPTGKMYKGVDFCRKLCGVSVIRAGESMEAGLRAVAKNIRIGKILLQREGSDRSGTPKVIYAKTPSDIKDRHVLLLDPVLATGDSVTAAVSVLMKRGVQQDRIIVITMIAAPTGIHHVCARFPQVKVLTSEIDDCLDEKNFVLPGVGDFGDRYFGTVVCR